MIVRKNTIDTVNKIILFCYGVLFIIMHTVLWRDHENIILWGEYILGMAMVTVTLAKFAKLSQHDRSQWIRMRQFFFLYFVIRIITTVRVGFGISTMRAAFFEGIYFLALSELTVDFRFVKRYIFPVAVGLNLFLNIFNLAVFLYGGGVEDGIPVRHVEDITNLEQHMFHYPCMVYHNINYMGIFTSFCIFIVIALLKDKYGSIKNIPNRVRWSILIYMIISAYSIWFSASRAANVALCLSLLIIVGNRFLAKKGAEPNTRKVVGVIMLSVIIVTMGIIGFIVAHWDTGIPYNGGNQMTELEKQLNVNASSRYVLWKTSLYSAKENRYILFGIGSEANEKRARDAFTTKVNFEKSGIYNTNVTDYSHPHNGYIDVLVCTGLLGTVFMGMGLLFKIKRSVNLSYGLWYASINFVLIVNLFECITPIQRKCIMFLAMCILAEEHLIIENGDRRTIVD